MSDNEPKINLKKLAYSPLINPLVETTEVPIKRSRVRTGAMQDLVNPVTGEISHTSIIHKIEEKDDAEFVKVFADGVARAFDLNKTSARVFQAVLEEYQRTPMSGGFADTVELFWFGEGLSGRKLDMSEKTFQRGLKDLLAKGFLYPKSHSIFWVNPSLVFKGDRAMMVQEYRRRSADNQLPDKTATPAAKAPTKPRRKATPATPLPETQEQ